jgi:SAM-dependent methyltransferase
MNPAAAGRVPRRARPELAVAALAFLVSGASGLVYQVAWQRILALHSGVGIYSIAMIVGAFMAGLGVGSHAGGRLSLRLDARRALRLFALVELAIGAFGAMSCWIYYDLLYQKAWWLYSPAWRAGLLHFLGLFVPTFLMGTSLPFLVRGMVAEVRTAGRTVGLLYGINLLGAAIGAALTPWVLIRVFGIRHAVYAAACGNLAAALLGLAAGRLMRRRAAGEGDPASGTEDAADAPRRHRFGLWLALYASSGFCALALENLWFRVLEMAVKSTAYTFGTVLALYLLGSAIGCLVGAPLVGRLKDPLKVFLALQCALLAYAGLAIALLATLPLDTPGYSWFPRYWGKGWFGLGSTWEAEQFWNLYVFLPAALFGPPTVLMGLSFPTLQRAVHDDLATSGRKVGLLQAANIAGCVAGSLLVGLVALDLLGTTGTFRVLMAAGLGFAAVGIRRFGWRSLFPPLAAALAVLVVAMPGQRRFWMRLHGTADPRVLLDEDASGVGALVPTPKGYSVFVHGKSHSWIPYGGAHTRLGASPSMIHPAPLDVAIIGLGSGDTAWASAARPETRSLTVFEISGPQPRLLRRLADREDYPDLRRLLDDPRLRVRVADGRNALEQEGRLYDVIEADALWPIAPYSGNLYSVEFFRQCLRRLKPGGILCTWAPSARVYASFAEAMPYIVGLPERDVLYGSNQPFDGDVDLWKSRALSPGVVAYLGREGASGTASLLQRLQPLHVSGRRLPLRNMNFDLFPRDEYHSP